MFILSLKSLLILAICHLAIFGGAWGATAPILESLAHLQYRGLAILGLRSSLPHSSLRSNPDLHYSLSAEWDQPFLSCHRSPHSSPMPPALARASSSSWVWIKAHSRWGLGLPRFGSLRLRQCCCSRPGNPRIRNPFSDM